jgi:hypothetical protein
MATKDGKGGKSSKPVRRIVSPRKEGGYEVKAPNAKRASAVEPTKKAAGARAKQIVTNKGGGEVTYRDNRGRIADSDTVGGGNDPNPPRDTRH